MYVIPEDEAPVDIDMIVGTASPEGTSIIGSWNGLYIALHTLSIDSLDLLFLVVLHELFHVLHFGDSVFDSLTTVNDTYIGSRVADCVSNKTVHTDELHHHWALNTAPFSTDFMEPVIPSDGNVHVSRCSATAAIETKTTWTLMACDTSDHCETNYTCVGKTSHLVGVCLHVDEDSLVAARSQSVSPVRQFPQLTAFVGGVFFLLNFLLQCARKHPGTPATALLAPPPK